MTTKKNFYSAATLMVFAFLFWASAPVQKISTVEKTYHETKKQDESITVSYKLPIIKPTGKTTQEQTKGSTTFNISVIPFEASRKIKQNSTVAYADANKPGFDIFEVENVPYYSVSPEKIRFKLRVSNSNEDIPLELSKITFAIFMDGTYWDFPEQYERTWEKGLVSSVSPKEYIIDGPPLNQLYSSKEIMINLSGVPTGYDKGGYVTTKEKFVWYFQCDMNDIKKDEMKTYTYETSLVETRKCAKCSGTGTDPQPYKCSTCKGNGRYVSLFDGKTYKCSKCDGSGVVYYKCENCSGKGITYHPKSQEAPIKSSVTWNGWQVDVKSIPSGATIKGMNTTTGQYGSYRCTTPCKIDWYCTSGKSCPIIVEYNGQSVKVMPYKQNGKESGAIAVDFTSGTPVVTKGKKVN